MADFFTRFAVVLALCWASAAIRAEQPKKDAPAPKKDKLGYNETILAHFKQPADTASLIGYLKEHSKSDDDLLAIPDFIKQLGSGKFAEREEAAKKLKNIGLPSFMPLLDAMNDKDPERAGLAKSTIGKLDRGTHTVSIPPVAIRMLMKRKPPELLETLLRYLPFTTDPEVEEDIYYDIDELAVKDGKIDPLLVKALDDKLPARRAVAGCIVARVGTAEQKKAAEKLLKDDDPNVRLRTAQGFLAGGQKTGIPVLIALLDGKPVSLAWQAEELLIWLAGDKAPKELVWAGGERAKKARSAWEGWWREGEGKVNARQVMKTGRTPCLFKLKGCAITGSDGRTRWASQMNSTYSLLPNDRVVGSRPSDRCDSGDPETPDLSWFEEYTLDDKFIRRSEWEHRAVALEETVYSANGIAHVFGDDLDSIGIEGRALPRLGVRKKVGNATVRGLSDGLVWATDIDQGTVSLIDPRDGASVLSRDWYDHADNALFLNVEGVFQFGRGKIVIKTFQSLWLYDFNKLHPLANMANVLPMGLTTICSLRGGRFATNNCYVTVYYSADWKVVAKTTSEEIASEAWPVLGFGFR